MHGIQLFYKGLYQSKPLNRKYNKISTMSVINM